MHIDIADSQQLLTVMHALVIQSSNTSLSTLTDTGLCKYKRHAITEDYFK